MTPSRPTSYSDPLVRVSVRVRVGARLRVRVRLMLRLRLRLRLRIRIRLRLRLSPNPNTSPSPNPSAGTERSDDAHLMDFGMATCTGLLQALYLARISRISPLDLPYRFMDSQAAYLTL